MPLNYLTRIIPLFFVALLILAPTAYGQDGKIDDRGRVCMMQDTVMDKPGIPVRHLGKTYYGCCPMCSQRFLLEPARHTVTEDPVTHSAVDKATAFIYAHKGRAYYFESEASRATFSSDPDRFTAKAIRP